MSGFDWIAACPACGSAPVVRGETAACPACGADARIEGNIADWRRLNEPQRSLADRFWPRSGNAWSNLRRLLGIAGHYLHPFASPASPLAAIARARLQTYYARTLTDRSLAERWARHYLPHVPLGRDLVVLDHGAGRGRNLGFLTQLGCRVFAQDIAPHDWWKNFPDCRFQIVPPQYDHLPWPSDYFGLVLDWGVIEHFDKERLARLVAEIARVLKSGGRWLVLASNPEAYGARVGRRYYGRLHAVEDVAKLAAANGLEERAHTYEGFQPPVFPLIGNGIRKILAPWPYDMSDYESRIVTMIPMRRRWFWLAELVKP